MQYHLIYWQFETQDKVEVLIEDQLVFLSELGELSGQAAVNIKKRLSK